jgi:hypothetical protein
MFLGSITGSTIGGLSTQTELRLASYPLGHALKQTP